MEPTTTSPDTPAPAGTGRASPIIAGFLLCIFAVGTAELLVGGLLPEIAVNVHVSVARTGQLVTAYALGVVIGGPLITTLTARVPRKGLVLGLIVLFIAGSLISAVATSYGVLVVSRVLAALSQASLFAISMVVVTTVVPPDRAGRAIATVVSGPRVRLADTVHRRRAHRRRRRRRLGGGHAAHTGPDHRRPLRASRIGPPPGAVGHYHHCGRVRRSRHRAHLHRAAVDAGHRLHQ
jgi:hypothetical protein